MAKKQINPDQLVLALDALCAMDDSMLALPTTHKLTCFRWNNEFYMRVIPAKSLFRSSLVHEVINRGDIFAVRMRDQLLTIVPGTAKVTHLTVELNEPL